MPTCRTLFGRIEVALDQIQRDQTHHRRALVVSTTGSFAATWLVGRLGQFTTRHPDIDVEILTSPELIPVGIRPGCADLALRHGLGTWPGLEAELLRPRLVPVAAPSWPGRPNTQRRTVCGIRCCTNCGRKIGGCGFGAWGRHTIRASPRGSRLADTGLLVGAAVAGQGLALLRDTYVAEEVAAGRLRIALDAPWPARFAYYCVTLPGSDRARPSRPLQGVAFAGGGVRDRRRGLSDEAQPAASTRARAA